MKKFIPILCFVLSMSALYGQKATYDDVLQKRIKGSINVYVTRDGQKFSVGDTITLGKSTGVKNYEFIVQNAGLSYEPLQNAASASQVVIKSMNAIFKKLSIRTTKPQGYVFALFINNFEGAVVNGEITSNVMSSDEALKELKKWKSKLDLEIITQEEYDAKKKELVPFIK